MIAFPAQGLVFLHVPKNGGNSIREAIKSACPWDHSLVEGWDKRDGRDLAHLFPSGLKHYFPTVYELLAKEETCSFAVLRDPLARCVSAFREHRAQYRHHPEVCVTLMEFLDRIEKGPSRSLSHKLQSSGSGHDEIRFIEKTGFEPRIAG